MRLNTRPDVLAMQLVHTNMCTKIAFLQARFNHGVAMRQQAQFNKFYDDLKAQIMVASQRLYPVLVPALLHAHIAENLWKNREILPELVMDTTCTKARPVVHPIEYVLHFHMFPAQGQNTPLHIARQGTASNSQVDLSVLPQSFMPLIVNGASLTLSEKQHNVAVVELYHYIHRKENMNKRRAEDELNLKRALADNRLRDDVTFCTNIQVLVQMELFLQIQPNPEKEAELAAFQFCLPGDVPHLLGILTSNPTFFDGRVPVGCQDTQAFRDFVRNLGGVNTVNAKEVRLYGHHVRPLNADTYNGVLVQQQARVDISDLLRVREVAAEWVDACANFKAGNVAALIHYQEPLPQVRLWGVGFFPSAVLVFGPHNFLPRRLNMTRVWLCVGILL